MRGYPASRVSERVDFDGLPFSMWWNVVAIISNFIEISTAVLSFLNIAVQS